MYINQQLLKTCDLTEEQVLPGFRVQYLQSFLQDVRFNAPIVKVSPLLRFFYKVIEQHFKDYQQIQASASDGFIWLRFFNAESNGNFCNGIIYTYKDDQPEFIREDTQGELFGEVLITKSVFYKIVLEN